MQTGTSVSITGRIEGMKAKIYFIAALLGVYAELAAIPYMIKERGDIFFGGEYLLLPLALLLAHILIESVQLGKEQMMYRNSEHYPDPVFGEVIENIQREEREEKFKNGENYMKWVYIASPYRGDVKENTRKAKKYSKFAEIKHCVPMCPFTAKKGGQPKAGFCGAKVMSNIYFTRFLRDDDEYERSIGLNLALQMLKRCKEIWVFGDVISEGMQGEIKFAEEHNIPIRYFTDRCEEVSRK